MLNDSYTRYECGEGLNTSICLFQPFEEDARFARDSILSRHELNATIDGVNLRQ